MKCYILNSEIKKQINKSCYTQESQLLKLIIKNHFMISTN